MPLFENLDFLNLNSVRSFPIKEGLSCLSTDSAFLIPDQFILDFTISANANVESRFFVSRIQNTPEIILVEISDEEGIIAGLFTITVSTHQMYQSYYMAPTEEYVNAMGKIVIGTLSEVQLKPTGSFSFVLAATEFEMRCVTPSIANINRFRFIDEIGDLHTLTGDVILVARNNLAFRLDADTNTVILDAGDGLGLNKDCGEVAPCIKTIQGISPDEDGNFTFIGSDCADFQELDTPPGLLLKETCCKPCMGCDEISELTRRAMQVETDMLKLRDFVTELQNLITEFSMLSNYSCEC